MSAGASVHLTTTADLLRAYLMTGPGEACRSEAALSAAETETIPAGLVDIRSFAPTVFSLGAPPWSHTEQRFLVRPEVAERIRRTTEVLPSDLRLGFWEGLRPVTVQRRLWESSLSFLKTRHPELTHLELEFAVEQYVARPDGVVPPHSTGAAVDVAPVDGFGRVLTPADAWGKLAVETISRALRESGLANYNPEWWHWSYGDEEWARAYDCAPLPFASTPDFDGPGGGI